MRYVLIDSANMFFRARHVAFRAASAEEKVGYALHITLAAINKVANKFQAAVGPASDHGASGLQPSPQHPAPAPAV